MTRILDVFAFILSFQNFNLLFFIVTENPLSSTWSSTWSSEKQSKQYNCFRFRLFPKTNWSRVAWPKIIVGVPLPWASWKKTLKGLYSPRITDETLKVTFSSRNIKKRSALRLARCSPGTSSRSTSSAVRRKATASSERLILASWSGSPMSSWTTLKRTSSPSFITRPMYSPHLSFLLHLPLQACSSYVAMYWSCRDPSAVNSYMLKPGLGRWQLSAGLNLEWSCVPLIVLRDPSSKKKAFVRLS